MRGPTNSEIEERAARLIGDPLLTARETAAVLTIHVVSLHRWVAEGRFPKPIRIGRSRIAWRRSVVDGWINERAAGAANAA